MGDNSILCVLTGLLVIAARGPLIFAPRRTLRFYGRLVSNSTGMRSFAVVLGALAVALLAATVGEDAISFWLRLLGWMLAAMTMWVLVFPGTYRLVALGVIRFFLDSVDTAIVRGMGLFAVALGGWLVYLGIRLA